MLHRIRRNRIVFVRRWAPGEAGFVGRAVLLGLAFVVGCAAA